MSKQKNGMGKGLGGGGMHGMGSGEKAKNFKGKIGRAHV